MTRFEKEIETQELINKLIDAGFGSMVNSFLSNEREHFTKNGRLNKSGTCRQLQLKPKQLEDMLANCRELLKNDYD